MLWVIASVGIATYLAKSQITDQKFACGATFCVARKIIGVLRSPGRCLGLLAFSPLPLVFVTFSFLYVAAVRGMTRSPFVVDRLTVEQSGCTCFRFNLIHGTQVTLSFTTTLVGVGGIFGSFSLATLGGRGTTSTQVFLEKFLHVGVILPLKG